MNFVEPKSENLIIEGHQGRPSYYPFIEDYDSLLFYIQRNQNLNSVIYEVNLLAGNLLNLDSPLKIHWLKYEKNGDTEHQELNYLQKKLAYGYQHSVISDELVEFRFVSYDQMKLYLGKNKKGRYRVFTKLNTYNIELTSIYIYSEDFGVFPQVKFAEFFGKNIDTGDIFYKKLNLE
ncbi:MAG: DUF4833 domain-containing protein [Saprospiraceae bacterium]|jgi:hypothetical protein|nr:DUF4833 domain-containing protein [Saprospiraceae bacterium]